jgi:hypothetical protein
MRVLKRLVLFFAIAVLATAPLAAHEGHVHRYMGTIATATDSQLSLKTTDGKTLTFKLDETTKIVRGKVPGGVKDLEPGTRAVIEAEGGKEAVVAKTIRVSESKANSKS